MKTSSFQILSFGLLLCLAACQNPADRQYETQTISISSIENENTDPATKAEKLAKAAEDLLSAQGYVEAHQTAELALQQDPNNTLANFIKAMTAPLVVLKGIYVRISPLYNKDKKLISQYKEMIKTANEAPKPSLYDYFMAAGQPDITTEAQAQSLLDEIVEAANELRVYARDSKDVELTIKANTILVTDMVQRYARACELKTTADGEYTLTCPSAEMRFNVKFERTDFEEIQSYASYFLVQAIVAEAYDLSGAADLYAANLIQKQTPEQLIKQALQNQAFGKLRSHSHLKDVKGLTLDLVRALDWANSHKSEACPSGMYGDNRNRPGMWADTGFCADVFSYIVKTLEKVATEEPVEETWFNSHGHQYNSNTKWISLFDNPVQDIRAFGPFDFDSQGQLSKIQDQTFDGVFPKGDANTILKYSNVTP